MSTIKFLIRKIYRSFFADGRMVNMARKAGVKVGDRNEFMSKFWLPSEPYLIRIGDDCQITAGVKFFTHGGGKIMRLKDPLFDVFGKIEIGNNVYIGNNAMIMPGVMCGNNVIIAAGSVVTKSIPNNVVVGGNPAKILCTFDDYYMKNLKYNTKTKSLNYNEKKNKLLSLDDSLFIKKDYMISFKDDNK